MTEPSHDSTQAGRGKLSALLLVALAIRIGWGLIQPTDPATIEKLPDQREYLQLSDHLLDGTGLHFFDPRFNGEAYAYRTPGYPLFLAACGGSIRIVRLAQGIIDASTVLAIYLLARRWFPHGPSLFAAALVAFNPFLIYFSALILSETLYTSLLAWGMLLLPRRAISGGIVLALSVLVRPSGILLPILLVIAAALLNRGSSPAYPRWWPLAPAATMLLLIGSALLPWAYRNHDLLGQWVWTTTNGGITAYDGFNDQATGGSDQRFARETPGLGSTDELQRNDYFAQEAARWIRHHPRRVMELALAKIARTWSPVPLSAEFGRPLYRWAAAIYSIPLDLLVILGLGYGRIPRAAKVFLLLPAIYFTAVHAMSVGSLRYRLPVEPPMAVIAVASCHWLVASNDKYRRAGYGKSSLATGN